MAGLAIVSLVKSAGVSNSKSVRLLGPPSPARNVLDFVRIVFLLDADAPCAEVPAAEIPMA